MARFETPSGRRPNLTLPRTDWPELKEAVLKYEKAFQERRVTQQRLGGLARKKETARHQDVLATANAIREGKKEPEGSKRDQIEKEAEACERRFAALDIVLDEAEAELIATVGEHRDEWLEEVEQKLEQACTEYADTIENLARARARVSRIAALRFWVKGFPEDVWAYRGGASSFVLGLKAPNEDPYYFQTVIDALRSDAEYKQQSEEERFIPWGKAAHEAINEQNATKRAQVEESVKACKDQA